MATDPVFLDNLLRFARMQNIFGQPQPTPSQSAPMPVQQQMQAQAPMQQMQTQRQPSPYEQHLANMPVREEPNTLNKIFSASAAGLSNLRSPNNAPGAYERLAYQPYYRALEDWETKGEGLKLLSGQEDRARGLDLREETNALRELDLERKSREGQQNIAISQQRADTATERAKIAQQRADVYAGLAKGGTIKEDENGQMYVVYKDGSKTDVNLDGFSTKELEELRQKGKSALSAQNASQASQLEGQRQAGRSALEDKRITGRVEVKKTPSASSSGASESATQKKVRLANIARQVQLTDPKSARFIKWTGTNEFAITAPGKMSGPSPEVYRELYKRIYGEYPTDIVKPTEDLRARAINQLTKDKKPVTEANINFVMERMK